MNIKPVVLTSLTFSETVCNKLKLYNMSGSHVQKKNYFLFICIFKSQFRVARILINSSSYYHRRQCQIRVRFESRVETKFLEPLNQILKLKFLSPWFPCSHSFQKMYNTYMHPDIQKEKNWDNVKKIVISQGNFIKIFTL